MYHALTIPRIRAKTSEKSHQMRIILATPDFPPWDGGVSRVAAALARGLTDLGAEVIVLAAKQSPGERSADLNLPFEVFRAGLPKAKALKPVFAWAHLFSLVASVRPHLIFATSWQPFGLAAALLPRGTDCAIQVHGSEIVSRKFSSGRWRWLMGFAFNRAEGAIAVSNYAKGLLEDVGVDPARIAVIENGVSPERFSGEREEGLARRYGVSGKKVLITVTRLVKRKGIDDVIRSLPGLLVREPDAIFLVGGKGPEEERLKGLAQELGVADRVVFAGFVEEEELAAFYRLGDVFVLPSKVDEDAGEVEGFGISFLEAAAAGLPAVGGRSGGVAEAVVHEETGLLVKPGESGALADALAKLLSDEGLRRTMGRAARARVEESFTWEKISARYLDFFEKEVLGGIRV